MDYFIDQGEKGIKEFITNSSDYQIADISFCMKTIPGYALLMDISDLNKKIKIH